MGLATFNLFKSFPRLVNSPFSSESLQSNRLLLKQLDGSERVKAWVQTHRITSLLFAKTAAIILDCPQSLRCCWWKSLNSHIWEWCGPRFGSRTSLSAAPPGRSGLKETQQWRLLKRLQTAKALKQRTPLFWCERRRCLGCCQRWSWFLLGPEWVPQPAPLSLVEAWKANEKKQTCSKTWKQQRTLQAKEAQTSRYQWKHYLLMQTQLFMQTWHMHNGWMTNADAWDSSPHPDFRFVLENW